MSDLYEGLEVVKAPAAPQPGPAPAPAAPAAPAGLYDGLELAPGPQPAPATPSTQPAPRFASGFTESAQAGFQQSVIGLAWRRRLPDLVMNPETASWWERATTGITAVGADLPLMIPAGQMGAARGAAMGARVGGAPGAAVGGVLTGGAAMFAAPAAIRESLIQAYKAGDVMTAADWFNAVREVAIHTVKEGGIGAVTMGAGGIVARGAGKVLAPRLGQTIAVPTEGAGRTISGGAAKTIETLDVAAQIAAMTTMPAALEGRLPAWQEFMDAAIVIGGLKAGHVVANRMMEVYRKTGSTPAEQVADAQADPRVAADLARPPVDPMTGTTSGVPVKLDRIIAEAEFLARGGVPEAPNIRELIKEIKAEGPLQGDMVNDIERIGALYDRARQAPLTDPERAELEQLRDRVAALEGARRGEPVPPAVAMRFTTDQVTDAAAQGKARLAELTGKAEAGERLTDAERAERVFLTNAKPEEIARHFKIEPAGPLRITPEAREASAQRVHDDILRQMREVDEARTASGLQPLGEEHAMAVAALVRARARTRAERLGVLPEELYAERPLQIRDETSREVKAAEEAIPEGAPTFVPPEVDLFGAPIETTMAPRHLSENIPVQALPVSALKLSMDVPQFKKDANEKGVVQPLGGDPDPRGWAVQVWERRNGDLEVISGRHRLELWQRKGLAEIPAQVHREADGFTREMAARLDAELNIRDEQGSIADYAQYFKDSGLSKEAADERGLLARYKGKTGFAIARDASPDLLAAHRAGRLSDEAALEISLAAPGSERLQALGMAMVQEGKSNLIAVNTMKAVDLMAAERMAAGAQGDIFGFDDSAMREASTMAKRASSIQRKIGEQISAVSGASRRPELARKMGVDVQDPDGIQKRIAELKQEQTLWDNWPLHPELVARLRGGEVTGREGDLKQGGLEVRSPEFLEWFSDSKVVDDQGAPAVVYHGTADSFSAFERGHRNRKDSGWLGEGFYFTNDSEIASSYSNLKAGDNRNVMPLYLRIRNPYFATIEEKRSMQTLEMRGDTEAAARRTAELKAQGYDGVILRYAHKEGGEHPIEYVVFEPTQVKSPFNRGTFDRMDPNILHQEAFDLKPETPAELEARNAEAARQAMAKLGETGYGEGRGQADSGSLDFTGGGQPKAAERDIGGRPAKARWREETKIQANGEPLLVYRGSQGPLAPVHFTDAALGAATENPTSGLGVWSTRSKAEAGRYGPDVSEHYLDMRNPKYYRVEDLPQPETLADARAMAQGLQAEGYDGIIVDARHLQGEVHFVSFSPEGVIRPADTGTLFQGARLKTQSQVMKETEAALAKHGEDRMGKRNSRVDFYTAERLAEMRDPDAGPASLLAYVTDDFARYTDDAKGLNSSTKALINYVNEMAPTKTGPLYRVLGFEGEADAKDFMRRMTRGAKTTLTSERPLMSFTTDSPEGKTAFTHIGLDLSSQFGDHKVVIEVVPPAGRSKLEIGRDVSKIYSAATEPGLDVVIPKDAVFKVRAITERNGNRWVTLEPAERAGKGTVLFQSGPGTPWYSALERALEASPTKQAPAQGWKDWLKGLPQKGVKADEIKWSGIEEWLDLKQGKVSKAEVAEFLRGNGVKVTETMLGGKDGFDAIQARLRQEGFDIREDMTGEMAYRDRDGDFIDFEMLPPHLQEFIARTAPESGERDVPGATKFGQYTLPGAKEGSYRELLLTLPTKDTDLPPGYRIEELRRQTAADMRAAGYAAEPTARDTMQIKDSGGRVVATFDGVASEGDALAKFADRLSGEHHYTLVGPDGVGTAIVGAVKGMHMPGEVKDLAMRMLEQQGVIGKSKAFQSGHFDQPNVLAHVRFNEREDADGKRVLFVEEIQSDWAQEGKKRGFRGVRPLTAEQEKRFTELNAKALAVGRRGMGGPNGAEWLEYTALEAQQRQHAIEQNKAAPAAPFVTKTDAWVGLTLKRMIRYAAENGFDRVAWTTGEQQVGRYTSALRKAVDQIEWTKTPEGVQLVGYKGSSAPRDNAEVRRQTATDRILEANDRFGFDSLHAARQAILEHQHWAQRWGDGLSAADEGTINAWRREYLTGGRAGRRQKVVDTTEKEDALSDAIGKAMADRIIKDPAQSGTIEGENIRIDDTGMAGFYDRIVPKVAKEVLKKLGGGKIGELNIETIEKPADGNPTVRPQGAHPEFTDMTPPDRDAFQGAEDFPMGDPPLIGEAKILTGPDLRDRVPVIVILDHNGVSIGDANQQFMIAQQYPRRMTQDQALNWVISKWGTATWWDHMDVVNGELPGNVKATTKQMAFDITPELRAKALEGMPLFQGERASYQIAERLITTMQRADKSSVVHELGHDWLQEFKADAARPDAPAQIKADWETLRRELAIGEDGAISTTSHEQFARSVERYLADGEAPSIGLRNVFERFKRWLLDIYESLGNLRATVNPELRAVLDRMLATDQEIANARDLGVPRAYVEVAKVEEARKIVPGFKAEQASMEPYADALPPGPGKAPADSHVNYAYMNSPVDVKLAMQRMAEIDQAEIQRQRGGEAGVETWAAEQAKMEQYLLETLGGGADQLGVLRGPGAAGSAPVNYRLRAMKQLVDGAARDSARLRDIVLEAGHDATVQQQLEYMGSIERARMVQAEFLGERAAVARALNALKDTREGSGEIARMLDAIGYGEAAASAARGGTLFQEARTPAMEQAELKRRLDEILLNYKGKTVLDIARLHKEIGTLKGTFKFAKEIERASTWEMVVEGWKSSLLSGPVTHTTNLFGTEAFHVMRPAVDALASVIGMARGASPGMGESNRASMSEAVARLTGMLGGVVDAAKVGWATFKLDDPTGKTEAYRTAIPGRAGELIRIPLRMMGAEDAIVSTMYKRGELATLAIRQAFNEGMNPATREFADRVTQLKDSPTPEMEAIAGAAATRMTFNAPLGEKGVALQLFVNKWNLQWMIPFIRTPINITKEVARMSPFAPLVGEWRADVRQGGVAMDRALAEMALGTGLMTMTMAYAFSGAISGGGSPDPGKNRGKAGVEQPYSIKVGDTWYEYARIQPTGTLMGLAADIALVWDHMNEEEKDKVPKLLARAFANAVTNQTFLQGITNVVNAMSEPARFAPRFLQQLAGSMVPNVVGQPTAMADPAVREVNSALEAIQSRIPGLRQDLLPKRDWLGEPVQTKERLAVVGPVRVQPISEDKVRLEAARLDISMAGPPKKTHIGKGTGKLGEVEFTPEERNKFQEVGGKMAHEVLTNIVNAEGYDAIPDLIKKRIFAKVLAASHQVAAVQALPMDKRLAYLEQITERIAAELAPTEQ